MFSPIVLLSAGFLIGFFSYPYFAEELDEVFDKPVPTSEPPAADNDVQAATDMPPEPPLATPIETLVNETDIFSDHTDLKPGGGEAKSNLDSGTKGAVESPNELKKINGIGPTYAKRLFEGGVRSIAALAASDVDTLTTLSRVQDWQKPGPAEWIEEAKRLTES